MPAAASEAAPIGAEALQLLCAGRLGGATRLDLRGIALGELPPEVFSLAETLEVLDVSGNALHRLPDDMARLPRLRVLFCSDNRFDELPAVLGRCAALDIVGFKANRIEHIPAQALPASLRWLILTDNRIGELPDTLADCPRLQKLMLAGNRLRRLPVRIAQCQRLELLRIAANQFDSAQAALPAGLLGLPRLAWLAHAGNPFSVEREAAAERESPIRMIDWKALRLLGLLGEGASGVIHAALWEHGPGPAQPVAVKMFKGAVTSDGLPGSEVAACIAAGDHPNLVGVQGRVAGHPDGVQGLVLSRIPAGHTNLAAPPSLASCTRDVYAQGRRFDPEQARRIAGGVSAALAHLHRRGLVHGDLYAHNILVDAHGASLLGDFGAASFVPQGEPWRAAALQHIDRRALGWLIDELAQRCANPTALDDLRPVA